MSDSDKSADPEPEGGQIPDRDPAPPVAELVTAEETSVQQEADLPPVVSRLVIEIRSDGSRTVARGALEDLANDERVSVGISANSPAEMILELSKTLLALPSMMLTQARDTEPVRPRRRLRDRLRDRVLERVLKASESPKS